MVSVLDQFHHQILGNPAGPKLVFLHGLLGSAANWRKVTSLLEGDYHILVFDQRGHGRSFQPALGYSPENYAEDLKQILDEIGWERVILVGHSMGGRNALAFSNLWPQRVIGLVVEDIGPDAGDEGMARIEKLLSLVPVPFENKITAKRFLLEEFPKLIPWNSDPRTLAQFFYSNIIERDDGKADWRFYKPGVLASLQEGRTKARWDEWKALSMPVVVIRGGRSKDLDRATFDRMLSENSHAKGVEIPGVGHWIHFEATEEFVGVLKNFIASLPLGT